MEYSQELDTIKTEVTNSVKKIEDLSKSIKNLQENETISRIETKIDILAESDYSELITFSLDNLKSDLSANIDSIKNQLDSINIKLNESTLSANPDMTSDSSLIEDLEFLKENFYKINEKLYEINLSIKTSTAENDELNNRFESNITNFNSGFQNIYDQFNTLDNTFKENFADFKVCIQDVYDQFSTIDNRNDLDQIKLYIQTFSNKITSVQEILEKLKENDFLIKVDTHGDLIIENNEKLNIVLNETQNFSNRMSDEFSALANPLSSAIELVCELKDSLEELISKDDLQARRETHLLLEKFEEVFKNTENNLDCVFNASKQFYEKLEEIKNEFSNVSYDTNSKINDFVSKVDNIELKIKDNITSSEETLDSLREISRFAENQINYTSETLNLLKTNLSELSDGINFIKNDITDVSSKVNKVILNGKENSETTNASFNELKEKLIKQNESNTENINQATEKIVKKLSEEIKELSRKIENAEEISSNSLETAGDIKNALAHIAGWFDSAGKLIEENNKYIKKNSIEKVDTLIKNTEESISEQMKRLSDKLNRLEVRMESIESRLEKVQEQRSNKDVLIFLSEILEKVELSNERSKSGDIILSRLENLELKIKEMDTKKTSTKSRKNIIEEEF